MTLVPFGPEHVLGAAALVAAGLRRLRARVPMLPAAWEDPAEVAGVLAGLAERGTGLAAIDDGELVAFQAATILDGHGGRWSYTSDVGHASPPDPDARLRVRLYAALADAWVREACLLHAISLPVDDEVAIDALVGLGFGRLVLDLVADMRPIETGTPPEGVCIRRAGPADVEAVGELEEGLNRHLRASPIFLRPGPPPSAEVRRRRLDEPSEATFVAEHDGRAIGYVRIGPCSTDVATMVRDAGTASVTAAFTRPENRGSEVGSRLLAAAVDWAREAGYRRWAVDHETANLEAARFWRRHATPVAVSLARRLAPGTVP